MRYKPSTAVWELTMGCNMRCKHCGSCCENPQSDELTTEEAFKLCDDIGKLGLSYVTLSGGEPTSRKDWNLIAKRLKENNVDTTMITNGWLINDELIDKAIDAGMNTIAISIDGLKETHDFMRREGSFNRDMDGLDIMKKKNLPASVVTTVNKKNIYELESMKEVFIEKGVVSWQLQFGLPMGNLHTNSELVIDAEQIDKIIDFAYENKENKDIRISLADCIGYYNVKEIEVRKSIHGGKGIWCGCNAGKSAFGILCNGDILGCTSIRNKEFIEGNIKEKSIIDIWNNEDSFKWSRNMKKTQLSGLCKKCKYGDLCLGGCSNTRLCMEESIYGENKYCSYNIIINNKNKEINNINDTQYLYNTAIAMTEKNQFQIAELLVTRLIQLGNNDKETLALNAFINYMLGNYEISKEINEKLLEVDSNDWYANKGLGLNLCNLGEIDKGIEYLEKSVEFSSKEYMDAYHDLAVTLIKYNKINRAKEILKEAREKSEEFYKANIDLYNSVS